MSGAVRVLAVSGGVGGARLCDGFCRSKLPVQLAIAANTADDFEHLGLHISPDIDTILYTLAGLASEERGWGLEDESWRCLQRLGELGAQDWFQLGDRDLATHLARTDLLRSGKTLEQVTAELAQRMGLPAELLPMSNQPVRTLIRCDDGELAFQDYFVRQRCAPVLRSIAYAGIDHARPAPALKSLLADPGIRLIVICPSNPFVSVAPVLSVPGMQTLLAAHPAPVVAVSPIVGGRALKGPAAKMMAELGYRVDAAGVAEFYAGAFPGVIDHFVCDDQDRALLPLLAAAGMAASCTNTIMDGVAGRVRLADYLLGLVSHG